MFDTSQYSGFENLYFKVYRNLGLTSYANNFTSSTTNFKLSSFIDVIASISLDQVFILFNYFDARIKLAAAISEFLYFNKLLSKREISAMY